MAERLLHPLNASLPNAEAIRQESDTTLRTFVNNLTTHSAQLKEHGFINLKHLLRDVRAVELIKDLRYCYTLEEWKIAVLCLSELAFCDDVDVVSQVSLLNALAFFLEERVDGNALSLSWKPFYYALQKHYLCPLDRNWLVPHDVEAHTRALVTCIRRASWYFPAVDASEVVAAFSPSLMDVRVHSVYQAQACLFLFLPRRATGDIIGADTLHHWLVVWSSIQHCSTWDFVWASIFARFVHPTRVSSIDAFPWCEYVPFFFSALLSSFELPVAGKTAVRKDYPMSLQPLITAGAKPSVQQLVKLVIRLIPLYQDTPIEAEAEDDIAGGVVVHHLRLLFRVIRTQFYPTASMAGYFCSFLRLFVRKLSNYVGRQQGYLKQHVMDASTLVPVIQIKSPTVASIVSLVLPLAVLSMYLPRASKGSWASSVGRLLRDLAALDAAKVCQEVTKFALSALDPGTVNQTHIAPNALDILTEVTPALLYPVPFIAPELPTLMQLALPGLDSNDDNKTQAALLFFQTVLGHVRLIDPSDDDESAQTSSLPEWHEASSAYKFQNHESDPPSLSENAYTELVCALKAGRHLLCEWALEAVDRITKILETRGKASKAIAKHVRVADGISDSIASFMKLLLVQMSPSLRRLAVTRVHHWLGGVSGLDSEKAVMHMLAALTAADPALAMNVLMPRLLAAAEEAHMVALKRWYILCITGVARNAGAHVLPVLGRITTAIAATLTHEDKSLRKAVHKLLRRLLETLCSATLSDPSSGNRHFPMATPTRLGLAEPVPTALAAWDAVLPPSTRVEWRSPTPEMEDAALKLLNGLVIPHVAVIKSVCDGAVVAAEQLRASLGVCISGFRGIAANAPDLPAVGGDDSLFSVHSHTCFAWHAQEAKIVLAGSEGSGSLRALLLRTISSLLELLCTAVDSSPDSKSFASALKLARMLCCSRGPKRSKLHTKHHNKSMERKAFRVSLRFKETETVSRLASVDGIPSHTAFVLEMASNVFEPFDHVRLLYRLRKAEAIFAVPRAWRFGNFTVFNSSDEDADDDPEGERKEALVDAPDNVFGATVFSKASVIEKPYLLALSSLAKCCLHAYDPIRRKAQAQLSVSLTVLPWLRWPLHRHAVGQLLQIGSKTEIPYNVRVGLLQLTTAVPRPASDMDHVALLIEAAVLQLSCTQVLPVDKQQLVLQAVLAPLGKVVSSWKSRTFSASNPAKAQHQLRCNMLIERAFTTIYGDFSSLPRVAPERRELVMLANGENAPSISALLRTKQMWRVQLAVGAILNLVVAQLVPARLLPLHNDVHVPVAAPPISFEPHESVWLWAVDSSLSPSPLLRAWGLTTLAELLLVSDIAACPLPPPAAALLSNYDTVSQLTMAVAHSHRELAHSKTDYMQAYFQRTPMRAERGSGIPRPDDTAFVPLYAMLFGCWRRVVPSAVPHLLLCIQELSGMLTSKSKAEHDNTTLRARHVTVAEIFAGLVGNEHELISLGISKPSVDQMADAVTSIVPSLTKCPLAWISDWSMMVRLVTAQCDMNSLAPLVSLVCDGLRSELKRHSNNNDVMGSDETLSFAPLTRWLHLAASLLAEALVVAGSGALRPDIAGVRIPDSVDVPSPQLFAVKSLCPLILDVVNALDHPYKACRDGVAAFVADALDSLVVPLHSTTEVASALRDCATCIIQALCVESDRTMKALQVPASDGDVPSAVRAAENSADTLLNIVHMIYSSGNLADPSFTASVLRLALHVQSHPKRELSGLSRIVLDEISQNLDVSRELILKDDAQSTILLRELRGALVAPDALTPDDAHGSASDAAWSTRKAAVTFLTPFLARAVMTLSATTKQTIMGIIETALLDKQPEVQEAASAAVSAAVNGFSSAQQHQAALTYLRLTDTKMPRICSPPLASDGSAEALAALEDFRTFKRKQVVALRKRYAGVLGAGAIVRAHPFDVPEFLPEVLSALARHSNDPQPVGATVRKLFQEFKHTHQDNWEEHKLAFTPDQLGDLVELLVSSHYYA